MCSLACELRKQGGRGFDLTDQFIQMGNAFFTQAFGGWRNLQFILHCVARDHCCSLRGCSFAERAVPIRNGPALMIGDLCFVSGLPIAAATKAKLVFTNDYWEV
jgi:hypothetical protein